MSSTEKTLQWLTVDPADMPEVNRQAYEAYKAKLAEASGLRTTFETSFTDVLKAKGNVIPDGKALVYGYKFGRLAVAFDDVRAAKPRTGKLAF